MDNNKEFTNVERLAVVDSASLLEMQLPEIRFTVDEILPPGLTVFAGAPKVGKSFFVLNLCLSVATGQNLWCFTTRQGTVLYLALEDSLSRLQKRLVGITEDGSPELFLGNRSSTLDQGLLDQLGLFIKEHPNTVLIVIDTFFLVRGEGKKWASMYERDYLDMNLFQRFALDHDVSILLVHHGKKEKVGDFFDQSSGSSGMTAAADGFLYLDRHDRLKDEGVLFVAGRDTVTRKINIKMEKNAVWALAEEIDKLHEDTDEYVKAVALYLCYFTDILKRPVGCGNKVFPNNSVTITATELAEKVNTALELTSEDMLKPNMIKKRLTASHIELEKFGIRFESDHKNNGRFITFHLIPERAKQLRFVRIEVPIENKLLAEQNRRGLVHSDTVTGDTMLPDGYEEHRPVTEADEVTADSSENLSVTCHAVTSA